MASSTNNVKLGVCVVSYDGVDLGYTQGGVEVSVSTDTHDVNIDQFGKTAVSQLVMGRSVKVKVPLAETTLENMVAIMPGAIMTEVGGAAATGTITVATNPTALETILVNGVSFVITAAMIGATPALTGPLLAAALNASSDPKIAAAYYSAAGAVITVTYGNQLIYGTTGKKGIEGNAFTLVTGTAAAKVTMSAATLTGGTASTSKSATVTNGINTNLLSIAKELRLHPKGNVDASEDFVVHLAGTAGALNFSYKVDAERIYNVEFTGYPDTANGDRLFSVGL